MLSIPVSVKGKIYYITSLSADETSSIVSSAQKYKDITSIINFTISTVSPSDITITDLQNFNIPGHTDEIDMRKGSSSYTGPHRGSGNSMYYTITNYNTSTKWKVNYEKFTPNDMSNIGVILSKLIQNAHTHEDDKLAWPVVEVNNSCDDSCCNTSVLW